MIFLRPKFVNIFSRDIARNVSTYAKYLLPLFLTIIISLLPCTFQILPSFASYHQTANIQNESLKNKKASYRETRKRKHSKNKPNLKNQVVSSCQIGAVVIKPETLPIPSYDPVNAAVWNTANGKAYIFQGQVPSNSNQIVEYDPALGIAVTKSATKNINSPGISPVFDPLNGKIYLFGLGSPTRQIGEYDPVMDTLTIRPETLSANTYGTAVVWNPVNNKAYIFGGHNGSMSVNTITEYDPSTGTITVKAETLPSNTIFPCAVWNPNNNKAYILGGNNGSSLNRILEYDPSTGTVTTKAETLPNAGITFSAVWSPLNSKIYVFGGNTTGSTTLNSIVEYDPATGIVLTKTETLPSARGWTSAAWNPSNNKAYIFGGYTGSSLLNQIVEYTPYCSPPSNPVISSSTLNSASIPPASSYRITAGQTLVLNVSSTDVYPGNQVTISCNPPGGMYTPSPAFNGTGRLELLATAADVGNTYSYTFNATSNSGATAASTVTASVSVSCSSDGPNGICVRGAYCAPCKFVTGICATDPSCVFTSPSQPSPQIAVPTVALPIPQSPIPQVSPPPPSPTATPVQNITNSGSTSSQSPNIFTPQINQLPPTSATTTPEPSKGFIDASIGGIVKPQNIPTPTPKPSSTKKPTSIDFSQPGGGIKTDSAPYIDISKQGQ